MIRLLGFTVVSQRYGYGTLLLSLALHYSIQSPRLYVCVCVCFMYICLIRGKCRMVLLHISTGSDECLDRVRRAVIYIALGIE